MITFIFDYDRSRNIGIIHSDYLDKLREHFSVKDPIANIKKLRYGNFVPSRKYAITQTGRFKLGMFSTIANYVTSLEMPYKMIVTQLLKDQFFCPYNICDIIKLKIPLREYQEIAIQRALKQGNGVIEVGTGGGKTLIMASLINTIQQSIGSKHKTLVIVPGIQLVEQTYKDFITYGIKRHTISKWSGTYDHSDTQIIIASISILQSNQTPADLYKNVDLLLFDECHKLKKENLSNKIVSNIRTRHKFSFTGTMPEDKIDEWNIIGQFGPVLIKKTSNELQKEDYIANAIVQVIKIKYKTPYIYKHKATFLDPTVKYNEECDYIYSQQFRNETIAKLSHNVNKNILILVDRIEHGEILTDIITKFNKNKKVYFIRGTMEVDARENIRKIMEEKNNVICIAIASIFSTGINITNLHYILFAFAGKAKIKIIQSIGRGLRLHKSKDNLIIFDISDQLLYSSKHLVKRLSLYKKEKIKYAIKEINE